MNWSLQTNLSTFMSGIMQMSDGRLIAVGFGGTYYSDDEGDSWTASNSSSDFSGGVETDSGRLVFTSWAHEFPGSVHISDDRGETWSLQSVGTNIDVQNPYGVMKTTSGRLILLATIYDTNDDNVHVAVSDDDGDTWAVKGSLSAAAGYSRGVQLPSGRIVLVSADIGSSGQPYITYSDDDGETWTVVDTAEEDLAGDYHALFYDSGAGQVIAGRGSTTKDDPYVKSADGAPPWEEFPTTGLPSPSDEFPHGLFIYGDDAVSIHITGGNSLGKVFQSADGGAAWSQVYGAGVEILQDGASDVLPYPINSAIPYVLTTSGRLILITDNTGVLLAADTGIIPTTGDPDPPDPWWTGYEGVTEVRRA